MFFLVARMAGYPSNKLLQLSLMDASRALLSQSSLRVKGAAEPGR